MWGNTDSFCNSMRVSEVSVDNGVRLSQDMEGVPFGDLYLLCKTGGEKEGKVFIGRFKKGWFYLSYVTISNRREKVQSGGLFSTSVILS